jgi:CHAD domain-containing protein
LPTQREVEDKYSTPGDFALPDLAGLEGVATVTDPETVELSATYLDTPDFRLVRNHVTLRRRTGGADAGWHLKLPVTGGRDEVQRPLGRGQEVPAELADLVLARTRGVALSPVARLQTTRRLTLLLDADGVELAEIAEDEVRAEVLDDRRPVETTTWRELEVELAAGDTDLLFAIGERLTAAGATPAVHGSKIALVLGDRVGPPELDGSPPGPKPTAHAVVRAYLSEHLGAMLAADPRVRLDEPDAVHKMRVATRRMRSTLRTFRTVLDPDRARGLDARLKALAATLGVARDAEVQLERLTGHLDGLPDELVLGPVRRRVEAEFGGRRLRGMEDVLAELRGEDYLQLVEDLVDFVAEEPTAAGREPASSALPRLVRKRYRRLAKRMAAVPAEPGCERDVALHEARKAGKRVRYASEALIPVSGGRATQLAKRVEDLQEVLGDHQDSVVARPLIRELAVATAAASNESAFTYGLVYGREEALAAAAEARLDEVWRAASRKRLRRFLR